MEFSWKDCVSHPAWRGEKINAQAVIVCSEDAKGMEVKVSNMSSDNYVIKSEDATANFISCVIGDELGNTCDRRWKGKYDTVSVPDRIGPEKKIDITAGTPQYVWFSVKVPYDAAPGHYSGSLAVKGKGVKTQTLPIEFDVVDETLPAPHEWAFHLDLWQNPYAVARYWDVPLWSKEHFDRMRPIMKMLADAGQKAVTATIINKPWNGQTEDPFGSMVTKTRDADGNWSYDYTVFDKWVEFMFSLGIDHQINCYSLIPWTLKFDYVEAETGRTRFLRDNVHGDKYYDYWYNFVKDFSAHLKEKGWFDKTMIAMDERPEEAMKAALTVIHDAEPEMKVSLAGSFHESIQDCLYDLSVTSTEFFPEDVIAGRREKGKVSTYYICCCEGHPNTFLVSDPNEAVWLGWYTMAGNFDGLLRWAYNSWTVDPIKDARFHMWTAGDCFIVYPDGSSVRFEKLTEGIQDYEKARILKARWEAEGNTAKLDELEAALKPFNMGTLSVEGAAPALERAKQAIE